MIVVKEVDGEHRLVCEKDHTISFAGNFPPETIKAGTVGAKVTLDVGTEVDWWASFGITVGKCAIENSYIYGEFGTISDSFVCVNGRLITKHLELRSTFPNKIGSIRSSNLEADEHLCLIESEFSGVTIHDAAGITVLESTCRDSVFVGCMTAIRSQISNFDVYVSDAQKNQAFREGAGEHSMLQHGFILNAVSSTINDVKVSPCVNALILQRSTLKNSELDSDLTITCSMVNESKITGDMIHLVNCIFGGVVFGSVCPVTTVVDHRVVDDQLEAVEFVVMTGNHPERVESGI